LGRQAATHLQSFPDNLAANYVTAESHRVNPDATLQGYAHHYYQQFAHVANVEKRDQETADIGYAAYRQFSPADAIRTYAITDSAFDDLRHLERIIEDSERADLDPAERDNVAIAAMAARLHHVTEKLSTVAAALDDY
jgi:hypothetical protein